ncbi:MAG: hypothetical protein ABI192_19695 [Bradyrhizobium sp.]
MARWIGVASWLVAAVVSLHAVPSLAADAVERMYNPPVGSHWIIEAETRSDEARPEGARTQLIKTRAELSIDEKTADGFHITYVNRGATAEGNAPVLPVMLSALKALENVPIHATTDLAGKPVRVDNLDEARAAVRNMLDTMMAPFKDKPQLVAVLTRMVNRLVEVDANGAAAFYLEELPALAKAQNTGMKPGEVKQSTTMADNPLGGGVALKSNAAFELTEADAATGKRVFVQTSSYDPASMKDLMQSVTGKLMAAAGDPTQTERVAKLVKEMVLTQDETTTFEVEDGMTRKITEKSVTVARVLGHSLCKTETKTVIVTRAP